MFHSFLDVSFCFVFRFGRRSMLLVSYLSTMVFALLSAFSTSYVMFVIMRFFTGMSLAGISIISVVLSEYTDSKTVLTTTIKERKLHVIIIACHIFKNFFRC